MGNLKGEEATIGLKMAQAMLGNSKEVSSMVRANGRVEPARQPWRELITMKENMRMIESMAVVFSHGQVETSIKENTEMMKDMDRVR